MPTQETSPAKLTTVAVFPQYYFLENLAVRHDGSILVTAALQKELWYVPAADAAQPAVQGRPPGTGPHPARSVTVIIAVVRTADGVRCGIVTAVRQADRRGSPT